MDVLLSVYGDGQTEHGDGLAALAPASGIALVAVGAPGGGRWPSSGGRVSCGRACGGRRARGGRRAGRRVAGRWSGSALRGRVDERTGAAPACAAGGAASGRAAAAE